MIKTDLPADWALKKAIYLRSRVAEIAFSFKVVKDSPTGFPSLIAFANYIEENEEPPVDPFLLKARELAAEYWKEVSSDDARRYISGEHDNTVSVRWILSILKTGYDMKGTDNG